MAALHSALSSLAPLRFDDLPSGSSEKELADFLHKAFEAASLAVDSVPPPPPLPSQALMPFSASVRSRSNTASSAGSVGSVRSSAARSAPPTADRLALQKEWKEVKTPGGPHDFKIYKLSSKDGQGAWFARRSVHEGIGFRKFRRGLRREFEEGWKGKSSNEGGNDDAGNIQIKPGVRGISCEKRIERRVVKSVGCLDTYLLSAQFPAVTAREFVEVCLSSAGSYRSERASGERSHRSAMPREFTLLSRPILDHPGAPPRSGFVRGKYESIEYIREIPPPIIKSRSSASLPALARKAIFENSNHRRQRSHTTNVMPANLPGSFTSKIRPGSVIFEDGPKSAAGKENIPTNSRLEGKAVSENGDNGGDDDDDDDDGDDDDESLADSETFPVEWIMITRSSPGGSVPNFLVERGTPGSIVTDAEKFLNWAVDKEHHEDASDDEMHHENEEDPNMSDLRDDVPDTAGDSGGADFTTSSRQLEAAKESDGEDGDETSVLSFQTASSGRSGDGESSTVSSANTGSTRSPQSMQSQMSVHDRSDSVTSLNLQRLATEKRMVTEKIAKQKAKDEEKQKKDMAKEKERQRKLEEKHQREAAKRHEKFVREQQKAEDKMRRQTQKNNDRQRKIEMKDLQQRSQRELEELRGENSVLRKEKSVLALEVERLKKEVEILKVSAANRSRESSPRSRMSSRGSREALNATPPGSRNGLREL